MPNVKVTTKEVKGLKSDPIMLLSGSKSVISVFPENAETVDVQIIVTEHPEKEE